MREEIDTYRKEQPLSESSSVIISGNDYRGKGKWKYKILSVSVYTMRLKANACKKNNLLWSSTWRRRLFILPLFKG